MIGDILVRGAGSLSSSPLPTVRLLRRGLVPVRAFALSAGFR
ncbi:hypothetical protein [Nonomuraea longispora]|nr:hypothetical protein [Nonomuraea longispora]